MTALVLTLFTLALGVVLVWWHGPAVLAVYLPMLPMALVLLWFSTTAMRFDERSQPDST